MISSLDEHSVRRDEHQMVALGLTQEVAHLTLLALGLHRHSFTLATHIAREAAGAQLCYARGNRTDICFTLDQDGTDVFTFRTRSRW